ncbi:terminase small subunit [Bacillus benzoevorans]|uniref:Phage terminase small subunit n=1 Tax=Bacillus benzoevorans TaxID=1456 RepID=A0A7X0HTC9_9BACI|nr:terminase small subunit [Bacillus benzoevorans]MBB6446475.1 phage terminase small subunit [Bacillus benzoevorans]
MPNWDEIRKEWETSDVSFKELAEKYNIKDSTIRSRKNREKWHRNHATQRKKTVATQKRDKSPPKNEDKETNIENDELTDKQRLFCLYYVKSFNQTMAAIKAGYSPERAHVTGSELVRNSKVAAEIKRIKGKMTSDLFIDAMDVLQKWVKIAFADITDFVEFGQKEIEVFNEITGEKEKVSINHVGFKNSSDVDGTIITEVKKGKDGVSIKLADKMKALEFLSKYTDLLSDRELQKLQSEKLKAETEFAQMRASKLRGDKKDTSMLQALIDGQKQFEKLATEGVFEKFKKGGGVNGEGS